MSSVDTSIGQGGTFAQGPASPVQPPGMGITTVPTFLAPPANLSAAFTSGTVVVLASFPPAGPIDGQQVILELPSTYDPVGGKKIRWAFAYNASDAVWDFIGGPALYAEVLTAEANAAGSGYQTLATSGPSIALPRPGDYEIAVGAKIFTAEQGYVSYAIGGAAASDSDAAVLISGSGATTASVSRPREHAALSAVTLAAQYKDPTGTGSGATFSNRWLRVVPVRIT